MEKLPDSIDKNDVAAALAWLRDRARLRQIDVVERVRAAGGSVSEVSIRKYEGGNHRPSAPMLEQLLTALGSDRAEFDGLLEHRPWELPDAPAASRARSRHTPTAAPFTPPTFSASPRGTLRSAANFAPQVRSLYDDHAPMVFGAVQEPAAPSPSPESWAGPPRELGEIAELRDIYARLPQSARDELLARARQLDPRR